MNQYFQISTPIPHPHNLLLSTFLSARYRLPRFTKCFIIRNTINAPHEAIRGVVQSLPLYRVFASHFKGLVGTFDKIDDRTDFKPIEDAMIYCDIKHDVSSPRVITLRDMKFYIIKDGKYKEHTPDSDLSETFFHILDPVISNKSSPVELTFVAYTNWSELTDSFINDNFIGLFKDSDKQIALTEYQHAPVPKDISYSAVTSWSTGARPNNVLHIRFDTVPEIKKYYLEFLDWMLSDLFDYIKTYVKTIPSFIPEGTISLNKDKTFSNYIMYSILNFQGVDCINNTYNYIPNVKINPEAYITDLEKHIKILGDSIRSSLSGN